MDPPESSTSPTHQHCLAIPGGAKEKQAPCWGPETSEQLGGHRHSEVDKITSTYIVIFTFSLVNFKCNSPYSGADLWSQGREDDNLL